LEFAIVDHASRQSRGYDSFEDRYLQMQFGVIVRMNQKTATVDIGDGQIWRVPFGLLRPAVDI